MSAEFLDNHATPIGIGCEGVVYQCNDFAYKVYHSQDLLGAETQAQRDARVINSLAINQRADYTASAVGPNSNILKTPVFSEFLGTEHELMSIDNHLIRENRRLMVDIHEGNVGVFNGSAVAGDVGHTISFGNEPLSIKTDPVRDAYARALPQRIALYNQLMSEG